MTMTAVSNPIPIRASHAAPLDHADLRDLLGSFMRTTQALEATHATLHDQVARLQGELADANAALRRSESLAALGQMAAGIAHEVRNPLGSIQLYAQILAEDLAGRPELAELCGKINRAVVGLDAIVRDVLTFARDTTIKPERIKSEDFIDRALEACQGLLTTHRIQLRRENALKPVLTLDIGLATQALSNVIRNAVEAMVDHHSDDRTIWITVAKHARSAQDFSLRPGVAISVRDTGPGIAPGVQDRIFNPFFTTRHTGTGLGLAIVHRIVDAHGGQVSVQNDPSGGACVALSFPTDEALRFPDGGHASAREPFSITSLPH